MKVKSFSLSLLFILILFSTSKSQSDSLNIFKTNSMQFRVYNVLSLSSFKGALISYKYHINDSNALRFGVSMRVKKWDEIDSHKTISFDTTFFDQDKDNNEINIEIIGEYIKYLNPQNEIKLFLGLGPRVAININNFDTDEISASEGQSYTHERQNDRYQIGLTFSLGVEWFFLDFMSLHAEYGSNISYFYEKISQKLVYINDPSDPDNERNNSIKRSGFEFDDTGALFGISIYF